MIDSPTRAVWTLFIGGVFIHPVAVLMTQTIGQSGKHSPHNPFGSLALATTFAMLFALPLAFGVSLLRIAWFFPAMLFIIGGRYLAISTIFGNRIYWFCGLALALAVLRVGTHKRRAGDQRLGRFSH